MIPTVHQITFILRCRCKRENILNEEEINRAVYYCKCGERIPFDSFNLNLKFGTPPFYRPLEKTTAPQVAEKPEVAPPAQNIEFKERAVSMLESYGYKREEILDVSIGVVAETAEEFVRETLKLL